jgi:hypothetical protein
MHVMSFDAEAEPERSLQVELAENKKRGSVGRADKFARARAAYESKSDSPKGGSGVLSETQGQS